MMRSERKKGKQRRFPSSLFPFLIPSASLSSLRLSLPRSLSVCLIRCASVAKRSARTAPFFPSFQFSIERRTGINLRSIARLSFLPGFCSESLTVTSSPVLPLLPPPSLSPVFLLLISRSLTPFPSCTFTRLPHRMSVRESLVNEASVSSLAIEAVDRRDSGLYSCRASNAFGSDETSIQLVVQGSFLFLPLHSILLQLLISFYEWERERESTSDRETKPRHPHSHSHVVLRLSSFTCVVLLPHTYACAS